MEISNLKYTGDIKLNNAEMENLKILSTDSLLSEDQDFPILIKLVDDYLYSKHSQMKDIAVIGSSDWVEKLMKEVLNYGDEPDIKSFEFENKNKLYEININGLIMKIIENKNIKREYLVLNKESCKYLIGVLV